MRSMYGYVNFINFVLFSVNQFVFISIRIAMMFVIVCCLLLSVVCAAPSFVVIDHEPMTNGLLARQNGTDDSEDTDANPLAVAWLVAVH